MTTLLNSTSAKPTAQPIGYMPTMNGLLGGETNLPGGIANNSSSNANNNSSNKAATQPAAPAGPSFAVSPTTTAQQAMNTFLKQLYGGMNPTVPQVNLNNI